jgi:hypothetical protein
MPHSTAVVQMAEVIDSIDIGVRVWVRVSVRVRIRVRVRVRVRITSLW